jgi:hypothetical protein
VKGSVDDVSVNVATSSACAPILNWYVPASRACVVAHPGARSGAGHREGTGNDLRRRVEVDDSVLHPTDQLAALAAETCGRREVPEEGEVGRVRPAGAHAPHLCRRQVAADRDLGADRAGIRSECETGQRRALRLPSRRWPTRHLTPGLAPVDLGRQAPASATE